MTLLLLSNGLHQPASRNFNLLDREIVQPCKANTLKTKLLFLSRVNKYLDEIKLEKNVNATINNTEKF